MGTTGQARWARHTEIRALDKRRRGNRITLRELSERYGCSVPWLSMVLNMKLRVTAQEARVMRNHVAALIAERQERATEPSQ